MLPLRHLLVCQHVLSHFLQPPPPPPPRLLAKTVTPDSTQQRLMWCLSDFVVAAEITDVVLRQEKAATLPVECLSLFAQLSDRRTKVYSSSHF